jgi:hypothetical protein
VVLRCLFDSRVHGAFQGLRASTPSARRMLFQADGYELDLEINLAPETQETLVTGQLVATKGGSIPSHVRLRLPGFERQVPVDEDGSFRTEALEPGLYRIEVQVQSHLLQLRRLVL